MGAGSHFSLFLSMRDLMPFRLPGRFYFSSAVVTFPFRDVYVALLFQNMRDLLLFESSGRFAASSAVVTFPF